MLAGKTAINNMIMHHAPILLVEGNIRSSAKTISKMPLTSIAASGKGTRFGITDL
jgi:hypothetical protein